MSDQLTLDDELSNLVTFYELGSYICSELDLDVVLTRITEAVVNLMGAEASSIITVDEANNQLTFEAAFGQVASKLNRFTFPLDDHSVAGWVVRNGTSSIINNAQSDPNFNSKVDRDTKFVTHNILCVPMSVKGRIIGCIEVLNKRGGDFNPFLTLARPSGKTHALTPIEDFTELDTIRLSALASQAAVAIDNARQYKRVAEAMGELNSSYYQCLLFLSDTIDLRDSNTAGHCRRVVKYTRSLAEHLGISDAQELTDIEYGALLHDVGKLKIDDRVLRKPGPLNEEEWIIMRKHPQYGYDGLKDIPFLWRALPIVLYHHEHWNGGGYPYGYNGNGIPIEARIFAVCDAFDAITSERPYKLPMSYAQAVDYFQHERGRIYDPAVVDRFLALGEQHWAALHQEVRGSPPLSKLLAAPFVANSTATR